MSNGILITQPIVVVVVLTLSNTNTISIYIISSINLLLHSILIRPISINRCTLSHTQIA